ncbi:MAG: hypothetical protein AABX83_02055, partial [Nanoarchaeota archaeon]
MKTKKLINLLALSLLPILGCETTPYEKRLEMFEEGKHLQDWPWVNNPKEYLRNNYFMGTRTVLWYNCVMLRYRNDDRCFLDSEIAKNLRDEYKKESEYK